VSGDGVQTVDSSRGYLTTEQNNPKSANLDRLTSLEIVDVFNQEDERTIEAIAAAREDLALAIDRITEALRHGGRLFYIGAGTSGRLGVLDASECPPTFCTPPELVQGIIAGGLGALVKSSEGLEDSVSGGEEAVRSYGITGKDVLVGIAAGGTTPYVHGALAEARRLGAVGIFMACVPKEQVAIEVDVDIRLPVGPEILAGSTRLKSGTVTKMALNILSTGSMVRLGKVYGNRMVDVAVTNIKLHDRALRILSDLTGLARAEADELLTRSGQSVKLALAMHWTGKTSVDCEQLLAQHDGNLRSAIDGIAVGNGG
jgi:N-acetylmuramic acid 6-phosphate etherase